MTKKKEEKKKPTDVKVTRSVVTLMEVKVDGETWLVRLGGYSENQGYDLEKDQVEIEAPCGEATVVRRKGLKVLCEAVLAELGKDPTV